MTERTMKTEWVDWILEHKKEQSNCRSREVCIKMASAFPELLLVQGYIEIKDGRLIHHWWLRSSGEVIVDPTAFGYPPVVKYHEWNEGSPTFGRCLNCRNQPRDGGSFCDEDCEDQYRIRLKRLNTIAEGHIPSVYEQMQELIKDDVQWEDIDWSKLVLPSGLL